LKEKVAEGVRETSFCGEKENHFEEYGYRLRNSVNFGQSPTFLRHISQPASGGFLRGFVFDSARG
jgi:hypothetical protein